MHVQHDQQGVCGPAGRSQPKWARAPINAALGSQPLKGKPGDQSNAKKSPRRTYLQVFKWIGHFAHATHASASRSRERGAGSQLPARGRASGRPGPAVLGLQALSTSSFSSFLSLPCSALLCPALPGSGCDHRMREFELGRDHESSHETCAPGRRGMCQDVPRMPSGRTEVTVIRGRPLNELQPTVPACKHEGA